MGRGLDESGLSVRNDVTFPTQSSHPLRENGMPQETRNRKFSRAALGAVFGIVLVIAGGTGVFAGDDDEDGDLPDTKFLKGLLRGFGLRNGQEAGIEYKERPPLVVPQSRDLPPPVAAGSLAAGNPEWPVDPDVKRRAAERKARAERKPIDVYKAGDALKPSELAAGRTDKPPMKTSTDGSPEMTPSQLGYKGGLWSSIVGFGKTFTGEKDIETATFDHEPRRTTLTDPPSGYRTPSPAQPYGINAKAEAEKAKAQQRGPTDRQTETVDK